MSGSSPSHRRSRRHRGALLWVLVALLGVSAASAAQDRRDRSGAAALPDDRTVLELRAPEEGEEGTGGPSVVEAPIIGMEAYREVLQTGEYLVGPGDKFLIYVSEREDPVEVPVLAEGGVFIPKVGRVEVGGLHLRDVRAAVEEAFRHTVRVGRVDVELSQPRQFPVSVVGLVSHPGVVLTSGVQRVSQVIQEAGGLLERASTRNILVLRPDSLSATDAARLRQGSLDSEALLESGAARRVDLTMYEATGGSRYNPFVVDGDIIVVPARVFVLRAMEAVRRPDTYEFVSGDRLHDLATLGMGPSGQYDPDNVFLFRYTEDGSRQEYLPVDLDAALAGDADADVALEPGDWLVARPLPEYQREVTVRVVGEVVYPGFYVVEPDGGSTLRDIIEQAGGYTREASLPKARVVRRVDANEARDPEFDRILAIPPAAWSEEEKQYFNMRSREKRGYMVVDFVALQEGDEEQNIRLRPGDLIVIPKSQRTVLVSGQAAYPGAVPWVKDFTVADYVERAGGPGWRASDDVRVIKARTGEIRQAEEVEQIEPGDNIWIKEKPVRNYWAIFTQSIQVAGQVATVVLLFVTMLR